MLSICSNKNQIQHYIHKNVTMDTLITHQVLMHSVQFRHADLTFKPELH